MKHHSILTTLLPRMAFSLRTNEEITASFLGQGTNGKSRTLPCLGSIVTEDEQSFSVIDSLIPDFILHGKKIITNLVYEEVEASNKILRDTNNPAVVFVSNTLEKENRVVDLDIERSSKHKFFMEIYDQYEKWDTLHITISIIISKDQCSFSNLDDNQILYRKARRREILAREVTTGYRRLISNLLSLIFAVSDTIAHQRNEGSRPWLASFNWDPERIIHGRGSSDGELHSTREDAWRLLCGFTRIEKIAKIVNCSSNNTKGFVLSFQDFVNSILEPSAEQSVTGKEIITQLFKKKHIDREIALRKTLEYYIFESLECIPNCS